MKHMKAYTKHLFYASGLSNVLDNLVYYYNKVKFYKRNERFKKSCKQLLPPDYFLYETYQLNYRDYCIDGQASAEEILSWARKYYPVPLQTILEWGCGVGRIIAHLPKYAGKNAELFGCDVNSKMIKWNSENIKGIVFSISGRV